MVPQLLQEQDKALMNIVSVIKRADKLPCPSSTTEDSWIAFTTAMKVRTFRGY